MEFVRKIIDANSLMKIMQLPETLMNRKLEIIILPIDDEEQEVIQSEISEMTQSLVGSIPLSHISLEQIRGERLKKYENII